MKKDVKKRIICILIVAMIISITSSCGSELKPSNSGSANKSESSGKTEEGDAVSYPGNPDIDFIEYNHKLYEEIWKERTALGDEWYVKCEIDGAILGKCTTEELLQLIISCPYNQEFELYSSYDIAWNEMSKKGVSYFDAFIERTDALEILVEFFGSMEIPETKLFDDSVFEGMTEEEAVEYVNDVLSKDDEALVKIHYDEEVVISVKMIEYLIQKLKTDQGISAELAENLEVARAHMYDQEVKSEYFGYGESLTEMVEGLNK